METYLWKINKEKLNNTNLARYSNFIKKNYKISPGNNFNKIWKWSVDNPNIFWKSIWDFTKVKGDLGIIFSSPVIRATFSEPTLFTHLSKISLANSLRGKPMIPLP